MACSWMATSLTARGAGALTRRETPACPSPPVPSERFPWGGEQSLGYDEGIAKRLAKRQTSSVIRAKVRWFKAHV